MKFSLENILDIKNLISELSVGLRKLTFEDNVEGFLVENVKFRKKEKKIIKNQVDFIPSKFLVVDQAGNGLISRQFAEIRAGHTEEYPVAKEWTNSQLFLVNTGSEPVIASIYFMR